MRVALPFALAVVTCVSLLSEDFWTAKKSEDWSLKEIDRLVTDSPWAGEARVILKRGRSPAAMPMADRSTLAPSGGPGSQTHQSGVSSSAQTDVATPVIIVRWESAAPIYEACAGGSLSSQGRDTSGVLCAARLLYLSGLGDKFAELRKNYYILSMSNYPKQALLGDGPEAPQHSPAATEALETSAKRLQKRAMLTRNGKDSIAADHAVILPVARSFLVLLFFPRDNALSTSDREISFTSTSEAIEVRSRFRPGKMVYGGRLEL